jgi:hypothetical protein
MDQLENGIEVLRLKNKNYEGRNFVPEADLRALMTVDLIRASLKSLQIPLHEHGELADTIGNGACKCYAILLLIRRGAAIRDFIKCDSLQRTRLDDRLPYSPDLLHKIFDENSKSVSDESVSGESVSVGKFLEKQWDFAIPSFSKSLLPRRLDTEAILPFLQEKYIGRGSFGVVWKVQLHPQHHELPIPDHHVSQLGLVCFIVLTNTDSSERDRATRGPGRKQSLSGTSQPRTFSSSSAPQYRPDVLRLYPPQTIQLRV